MGSAKRMRHPERLGTMKNTWGAMAAHLDTDSSHRDRRKGMPCGQKPRAFGLWAGLLIRPPAMAFGARDRVRVA
jgi:hypothetical protein